MSAHDQLERQLADSVTARRRRAVNAAAGRLRRLGPAAQAGVLALVLGALAAGGLPHGDGRTELAGEALAPTEAPCQGCQAVGGRLHGPPAEALAAGNVAPTRVVIVRRGLPSVSWAATTRGSR